MLKEVVDMCGGLLKEYIVAKEADREALQAITNFSQQNQIFLKGLPNVLNLMFNEDILQPEAIVSWYNEDADHPARQCYQDNIKGIISFIEQSSEEESSEEEDSD